MSPSFKRSRLPDLVTALPVVLGLVAFFAVVGPRALDPENLSWLERGDPAQHYLGWLFFRGAAWSLPIGMNPAYGIEMANAIAFTDSIPLLAFLFKPLSPLLPATFQYFGIWLALCFIMQAWFGWKLIGLFARSVTVRLLGAGFFVFAPPMLWRLQGHMSLVGHFLVVAALYFALHPRLGRRRLAWAVLAAVSALVHAYLLVMVLLLWLADLLGKVGKRVMPFRSSVAEFAAVVLVTGVACWQAGYLSVGASAASGSYGYYRMNLLSIVDASGWSRVLPDIPEAEGDYEGFNFLGLGALILGVAALPAVAGGRAGLGHALRRFPLVAVALAALTLFAVSHNVGIGTSSWQYSVPAVLVERASIFRSSGRMFWPVFYAILVTLIVVLVRSNGERASGYVLALALFVQVADTSAAWTVIRGRLMNDPRSAFQTGLENPFWREAASRYNKIRWIPAGNHTPKWAVLGFFAGSHGLATDAVNLARIDARSLEHAQRKSADTLSSGRYDLDSLYVIDQRVVREAVASLDARSDVLARVDGLVVVAPGWNACKECPRFGREVGTAGSAGPPVPLGERMLAGKGGKASFYLARGWSYPEDWGTWSDGDAAELVLPASADINSVVLEANALVAPGHPTQTVVVRIEDAVVATWTLNSPSGNLIDIRLPGPRERRRDAQTPIRIQLHFPDAVSPKEIGQGNDQRRLALALIAVTAR